MAMCRPLLGVLVVAHRLALASAAGSDYTGPVPFDDVRLCKGIEKESGPCEALPRCDQCQPVNCLWNEWSEWAQVGGCTQLVMRARTIRRTNNQCGLPCSGAKMETKQTVDEEIVKRCVLPTKDCQFGDWNDWSLKLGDTQWQRSRGIIQYPEHGGSQCSGPTSETLPAKPPAEAEDCKFSEWGAWSICSATCGGWRTQFRRVLKHAVAGGKSCHGTTQRLVACHECEEDHPCEMSDWSDWSCCDDSRVQTYRVRNVTHAPRGPNAHCPEDTLKETKPCPKVDTQECKLTEWTQWGECSVTCDGGQQTRQRSVKETGTQPCPDSRLQEIRPCGTEPCSATRDCEWEVWTSWETCSVTCGTGVKSRDRKVARPAEEMGLGCVGPTKEVEQCELAKCEGIDCVWGDWQAWSDCSATCGGGTKRRDRAVSVAPQGGALCPTESGAEVAACATGACEHCIDGTWMQWSDWSSCSTTCGHGFRSRHREVETHPDSCGKAVEGLQDEYETCSTAHPCIPDVDCKLGQWSQWNDCSASCFGVRERTRSIEVFASGRGTSCGLSSIRDIEECNPSPQGSAPTGCHEDTPRPCVVGAWGAWGSCSASCNGGQRTRQRHIITPAAVGGKPCEDVLEETGKCNLEVCEILPRVDCVWGAWAPWGDCTKCGGQKFRMRSIEQQAAHGGKVCEPKDSKQTDVCTSNCQEEMFCAWSDWSDSGSCSAECGPSTKERQRTLSQFTTPPHDYLFKGIASMACGGSQIKTIPCETTPCFKKCTPRNAIFGQWNQWSSPTCTQLCERHRHVKIEADCGGAVATGPVVETKKCPKNCENMPQDCRYSEWEDWSECTNDQTGQQFRGRLITRHAENDGLACVGSLNETRSCAAPPPSPVNCTLRDWSEWSDCSATCGHGYVKRTRVIATYAQYNGFGCNGNLQELRACDTSKGGTASCVCKACLHQDCFISEWSDWARDTSVKYGSQCYRSREVLKEAQGNGTTCSGKLKELKSCPVVVDCRLSDWTAWDQCDKHCGGGQRMRLRQIVQHPVNGGAACNSSLSETEGCNTHDCEEKAVCQLSDWSSWEDCSHTCGGGQQQRSRSILNSDHKTDCDGKLVEIQACGMDRCSIKDCQWGDWAHWSSCTCECAGGQRTRDRNIVQVPDKGGLPCKAEDKEQIEPCNTQPCGDGRCIDGTWEDWQDWEACTMTCEGGVTWRQRAVQRQANDCGKPPLGLSRETASCSVDVPCFEKVDCEFGEWSEWSDCTSKCNGNKNRARVIAVHARGHGEPCRGPLKQVVPCNPGEGETPSAECVPPKEPCELSNWASWSVCSANCGIGTFTREREVSKEPQNGGAGCNATLSEIANCTHGPCQTKCDPVDCQWGDWQEWGSCDKCGGQKRRFRHVVYHPLCGGKACKPEFSEETMKCHRQCHDKVFCSWADWGAWGQCDATCGKGSRIRTRTLAMLTAGTEDYYRAEIEWKRSARVEEIAGLDERTIEEKLNMLKLQTQGAETRRLQELIVAFACGGISLVALLLAFRIYSRSTHRDLGMYERRPVEEVVLE